MLTGGSVDVLCHAAVRARNLGVLLAACRDPALLADVRALQGTFVSITAGQVLSWVHQGVPHHIRSG